MPTTDRKPIPKRLRWAVLTRDDFTCAYCCRTRNDPGVKLSVDHVIPVVLGGSDDPTNLVTACVDCNSGKASTTPSEEDVAQVNEDALRWADAMAQAANEIRQRRAADAALLDAWLTRWNDWTYTVIATGEKHTMPLPHNWEQSLNAMLEAGADLDVMIGFVDVAMKSKAKDVFKYFCGCGWNHVRALQTRAREILAGAAHTPTSDDLAWSLDDNVREAYWAGNVHGFNDGYEDGWEQGLTVGRTQALAEDRQAVIAPFSLADLLRPPKEE